MDTATYNHAIGVNNVVDRIHYLLGRCPAVNLTAIAKDYDIAYSQGYTHLTEVLEDTLVRFARHRR